MKRFLYSTFIVALLCGYTLAQDGTTQRHRVRGSQYGSAIWVWNQGEETPEHTNQTGSYDHTGGAQEELFTKSAGDDFAQADEDNGNWIILTGTNNGAAAEIINFISTTQVIVEGLGWDGDFASQTFEIAKHPQVVAGDGIHTEVTVGASGNFEVSSYNFTGETVVEFFLNAAADSTTLQTINANANGFSTITGLSTNYITGALAAGEGGAGQFIGMDETGAVGADATTRIAGLALATTNETAAIKTAVLVLPGHTQALLVFGADEEDPDYGYDIDDTPTVTDRVTGAPEPGTAFLDSSTSNITLFALAEDYILIGSDATFELINVTLDTFASKTIEPTFFYSKAGDNWTALPLNSDSTDGMTQNGLIVFDAPGDWTKDDEAEVNGDITEAFYVKIVRTRAAVMAVLPIEDHFDTFASKDTGMSISGKGFITPLTSTDAAAPNLTIYFSTDQSKLVFKDGGGVIRDLY